MKKNWRPLIVGFIVLLLLAVIICKYTAVPTNHGTAENKINVVVTIPPLAEFAEKVGGDRVEVSVMVPAGASPHTYEPTPRQLADLSRADIYLAVGSGVEFELAWLDKIKKLAQIPFIDCSERVQILDNDPHIWLSLKNAKIMVDNIYRGLAKIDPKHTAYYENNKNNYLTELDHLDAIAEQRVIQQSNKFFLTYHPAWAYFCRDYGLEQIAIEQEGKETTSQNIINAIKLAKNHNIKIIFTSPEFDTKNAEMIAKEINGQVALMSPLAGDYLENMRQMISLFFDN